MDSRTVTNERIGSLTAAIGPRIRTSPFFDATIAAGLRAVSAYNHMWLPMSYGDPDAEYRRLTEAVSLWDVAAQRHIEVRGPEADRLISSTTVIDATSVEIGGGAYAPMVDHDGVLINDPVLLRFADSWRLSIADGDIGLWLRAIAASTGIDCTVSELPTATLAVQGPAADGVLVALGAPWASELDSFERARAEIDGCPVWVSRSGWSNQGGYELFLDDPAPALRVWDAVAAAGRDLGIGPGAPNPAERIENVLLSYGTDTGYDADPFELGLDDHVAFDRGPFVGRDALARIRGAGPTRRLRGALLAGPPMPTLTRPVPVVGEGGRVGELRAGTSSPRFGRNIGLALVDRTVELGAVLSCDLPDTARSLEIVELPFAAVV